MQKLLAAFFAASLITTVVLAGTAQAAQTRVNVRIEGETGTIFEGPVSTVPHEVLASSDKGSARRCDGINVNDPANTLPGVTPTATSADAMTLIGETFDGSWYDQYEDYFLTRWGPDAEDPTAPNGGHYWGVLVNNTFTNVGGCQYQLTDGDEVLWVYNAFQERPTLALFPEDAAYTSGTRPLTVTEVEPGESVPLEVVSYADNFENNPPTAPTRSGSSAYEGAKVSPVATSANGFQEVEAATGSVSDAQGKASVSYTEPGWHRIKATVGTPGSETVIRSNRLDICVNGTGGTTLEGASDCDELPTADRVRVSPAVQETKEREEKEAKEAEERPKVESLPPGGGGNRSQSPGSLLLSTPRLNRNHLSQGRVGVSWSVLNAGPGIEKWTISSQVVGKKSAGWVTRAGGAERTSATIHLARGLTYRLRFTVTDRSGETSNVALGKLKIPEARPRSKR